MPKKDRKCGGKTGYLTLEAAQAAAAAMCRKKDRLGKPVVTFLRAYGCHCGKFHYGSTRDIDWSKIK